MKYEAVFGDQKRFNEQNWCKLDYLNEIRELINNLCADVVVSELKKSEAAVPQWIPVSEQMPENEGTYFCLGHNGTPFVCLFRTTKYEGKIWLRSTGTKRVYGITHWMPLPSAPEQIKGGE